jgi:beta-mannanase
MKDGQTFGQWLKWDFEANGDFKIYDKRGNLIYFEKSSGEHWAKFIYDPKGEVIYYEDSSGQIKDCRIPEVIEQNGHKYQLIK